MALASRLNRRRETANGDHAFFDPFSSTAAPNNGCPSYEVFRSDFV
jgi:hypothetical protein